MTGNGCLMKRGQSSVMERGVDMAASESEVGVASSR